METTARRLYSKEYQEDLLDDFEKARTDIIQRKAHVLRSVNQHKAKQAFIRNLNESTVLVVMDWAMKFLQMKYREKQSDWYAKRGISWHVSTVIFKQEESGDMEVQTYAPPTCLITASRIGSPSALVLKIF